MDPSRRFSEGDTARISELQQQDLDKHEYEMGRAKEREFRNTVEHLASDAKPCFQNRESSHDIKQMVRTKPGRKVIYGPDSQPLIHK